MGAIAYHAPDRASLQAALDVAKSETRTVLIYVPIDPDARVPSYESWWDVPVAEVSGQPGVQEALARYRVAKEKQRFYH